MRLIAPPIRLRPVRRRHKHAPGGLYERLFLGLQLLWMVVAAARPITAESARPNGGTAKSGPRLRLSGPAGGSRPGSRACPECRNPGCRRAGVPGPDGNLGPSTGSGFSR